MIYLFNIVPKRVPGRSINNKSAKSSAASYEKSTIVPTRS